MDDPHLRLALRAFLSVAQQQAWAHHHHAGVSEVPLYQSHRLLAEHHHPGGLRAHEGERDSFHGWYLLRILARHTLLVWSPRPYFGDGYLHDLRRYERCNDHVGHPDTYPHHRLLSGALPRTGNVRRRQHHAGMEQYDDLLQPAAQRLWYYAHVPLE